MGVSMSTIMRAVILSMVLFVCMEYVQAEPLPAWALINTVDDGSGVGDDYGVTILGHCGGGGGGNRGNGGDCNIEQGHPDEDIYLGSGCGGGGGGNWGHGGKCNIWKG